MLVPKDTTTSAYAESASSLTAIVRLGLSSQQKQLPSRLLYDEAGSRLFEQITQQPEYQLTNWEIELLRKYANDIAGFFGSGFIRFYEFGAGGYSEKQNALLSGLRDAGKKVLYCPIDICRESVENVTRAVRDRFNRPIGTDPIVAEYADALVQIRHNRMRDGRPQFFFLPGANIGNFSDDEAIQFMRSVAALMGTDDHFMIGFDLVKDVSQMLAAYDDAAGITRQFNLNLLARLNRECGADFNLHDFIHHPFYDEVERSMKSELVSTRGQVVSFSGIPGLTVPFARHESIAVERSRKYSLPEIDSLAQSAGLSISRSFSNGLYADIVFTRSM